MIGIGSSLLFDRRAGKAGSPTPPLNDALVDAWFMSGLSNIDKPSSIRGVKGNEVVLKNFAYSLSSGFGKYTVDWSTYRKSNIDILYSGLIHKPQGSNGSIATPFIGLTSNIPSYSIKVEGLDSGSIDYYYRNSEGNQVIFSIKQSGIHKLPICYKDGTTGTNVIINILSTDAVTITQLPSAYEGALVFDGVDDYAYVDNFDTLIDGDEFTTIGYYEVIPQGNKTSYNLYARSSNANWSRIETPSITTPSYGKRSYTVNYTSNTSSYDILEGESFKMDKAYKVFPKRFSLNGWFDEANNYLFDISKVAHYWVAIYKGKLIPEEIETEKEKLNDEWLKRKTE